MQCSIHKEDIFILTGSSNLLEKFQFWGINKQFETISNSIKNSNVSPRGFSNFHIEILLEFLTTFDTQLFKCC